MLFDEPAAWVPTLGVLLFLYCFSGTFLFWLAIAAAVILFLIGLSS